MTLQTEVNLFDPAFSADPHPTYRRLRRHTPVCRVPLPDRRQAWLLTRYDHVLTVFRDDRRFSTRAMLSQTGDRSLDLIADFAFPLPVTVIMTLLGIPAEDRENLRRWSKALVRFDRSTRSAEELAGEVGEFIDYVRALLAAKRRDPGDDLLSALAGQSGDGGLTELELVSMTFGLIFSGHETTTHLLGNGMLSLLSNPAQLRRLRSEPALTGRAIEELLRYDGPVEVRRRLATAEVEIGGERIRRGELVLLSVAAANRDPERFARPEEFDIGRSENPHLAFGRGIHACLGASLARLEAQAAVTTLLRRLPELDLAVPRDELRWRPSGLHLRGLEALPLRF